MEKIIRDKLVPTILNDGDPRLNEPKLSALSREAQQLSSLEGTRGEAGQYPQRGYWPIKRPQRGAANPRRVFLQQLGGYLSAGGRKQTRCQICLFPKPENRHKFRSGGVGQGDRIFELAER